MTRIAVAVLAIPIAILIAACGTGDSSTELVLEADLSAVAPENASNVLEDAAVVLEHRADGFGVIGFEVETEQPDLLTVRLQALNRDDARRLLTEDPRLEIQRPTVDGDGNIVCESGNGAQFSIAREDVVYSATGPDGPNLPGCVDLNGSAGSIVWESAVTVDFQGRDRTITEMMIAPDGAAVESTNFRPVLVVTFTEEGNLLLAELTKDLVGLPLGISLNEEIVAGPTVSEPIVTGNIAIGGLSLYEARIVAAQMSGGLLPVPLSDVNADQE